MKRLVVLIALMAAAANAQSPAKDWRTITTPHFRVHYPAEYEAWSRRAASRLESIRDAVTKQVGFEPRGTVDVLVSNPVAQANGIAFTFLDRPRILFYTEPPGPEEEIGAYSDWIDLLAVHEVTHIVHLLRPSRNPLQRVVEKVALPMGPIMQHAPRWVVEGYATVIEGRLTGAGRPSSTVRAAILRKWAASGRLPRYGQLNSDSRFLGLSMAYLAGSAYLEWLENRAGPDSLRHLWTRMTARNKRSFDEAFKGVFGESPERLYGIFTAELTASAMALSRSKESREGELWQETSHTSGDPAVSPDGSKIAVVVRERRKPPKLVIWSTEPATEEEKKYEERLAKILKQDPEDIGPVRSKPLPRKAVHSFTAPDGGDILTPRWTKGGAILFVRRMPDLEGFLHYDLFLWKPETGQLRRVTEFADVSDADPMPDGKSAVAVRNRFGFSQLVSVDFATGNVKEMTQPSLDVVYSHPRVKHDGTAIAYAANQNGGWGLHVCGTDRIVCPPLLRDVSSPEWGEEDLFATVSTRGFAEIHRIRPDGSHVPLTRSAGVAFDPAPAPDGRVFFMGLEPDGFVVRVTTAGAPAPPQPAFDPALAPALPPAPAVPTRFASAAIPDARPYGIGRQEVSSLFGQVYAPGQRATEVGVRIGDVVGRLDTIAIGSFGRGSGQRGAAIASAWRGWPVAVSAHIFTAKDRNGLEVRTSWVGRWPRSALALDAGALSGKPFDLGFLSARTRTWQRIGSWQIEERLHASGESGTIGHTRGVGELSMRSGGTRIAIRYQRDAMRDGAIEVGGIASSIVPDSAFANRVYEPALAVATLTGKWHEGRRAEATLSGITFFVQEHRTDLDRRRLAGAQITLSTDPVPILRLARFDLTLGAARQIGQPAERDVKWWFGLRWTP